MKKFVSLKYKFLYYFLLISIIPVLLVGSFSYITFSKKIMDNAFHAHSQKMNSIASNIDGIMDQVNEVSHLILRDPEIRQYMNGNIKYDPSIMDFLSPFVGYDSNISSIYIQGFLDNQLLLGSDSAAYSLTSSVAASLKTLDGYYLWYPNQAYKRHAGAPHFETFSFSRLYKDVYSHDKKLGFITIDVPVSVIEKTYASQRSSQNSIFLIVDENGTILHSNDSKYLGETFKPSDHPGDRVTSLDDHTLKTEYLMTHAPIANTSWTIIDLTPTKELLSVNKTIFWGIFSITVGCIFFCIMLASYIFRRHLTPLESLCGLMQDAEEQNFKKYTGEISNDEIGVLASKFNSMSSEFEKLINQVYALQIKQREAELKALQAQINPHFLYNTLDIIYWACRLENAPDAAELIRALGDMFRLTLNKGKEIISLEDELRHLNCYLLIQKKRMKDSVEVILDVDSSAEHSDAKVIKLILQPLVENAFLHGVSHTNVKNVIKITISLKDDTVYYTVEDNGCGISDELLKQLRQPNSTTGFGLRNVNERIKLLFGEQYGITISSVVDKGTVITVTQPYMTTWEKGDMSYERKTTGC